MTFKLPHCNPRKSWNCFPKWIENKKFRTSTADALSGQTEEDSSWMANVSTKKALLYLKYNRHDDMI